MKASTTVFQIHFNINFTLYLRSSETSVHVRFSDKNYSESLWAGRSGDRIPVGVRFSAPVQRGPGAHPASHTMVTRSFSGLKRLERGVDHPPPSRAEAEGRVELYICSAFGPMWPVLGWTLPDVCVLWLSYSICRNGFRLASITCELQESSMNQSCVL